jgi:signal transduction histidine kinase
MWPAFAAAVLVVMAAMGWTTRAVLRLDAAEAESRRRAELEENVRLALWRMDSALAPLIAAEHARPTTAYQNYQGYGGYTGYPSGKPVYPAQRLDYTAGEKPEPVPLPGTNQPFARLYFQYLGTGAPTTPQASGDAVRSNLERVAVVAPFDRLVAALPSAARADRPDGGQALARMPIKGEQALRNSQEYQARAQNNVQQLQVQAAANRAGDAGAGPGPVFMRPVWLGEELVLARRVPLLGNRDAVQGCWVDWPAVRSWLLASVKDVLPDATLLPLEPGAADPSARQLASLPVRLVPGEKIAGVGAGAPPSPLRTSLVVAWVCVVLATAAVALLLRGVVALSERRGAFVSAVTHELRTPLTTLRMYTEMLEGGMVDGADRRQNYLATLRAEADRLGHLVENVLAYSKLERNRAGYHVTTLKLADVLPRAAERLAERARQAGMELVVDIPPEVAALPVRANALALEQILFNLVDNACKYAAGAADKRIHLSGAAPDAVDTSLDVRDHGPGVTPALAKRLFHPFSKSVQEAANTAPGLGLGLSLSRRLAQSMGGELRLDTSPPATPGARFVLTLPRA